MDERKSRVARNEVAFREINEGIRAGRPDDEQTRVAFLCECADPDCTRLVELTVGEYEHVRLEARCFFVRKGHEVLDAEDVVEELGPYVIVRKHADAAPLVEASDRRAARRR